MLNRWSVCGLDYYSLDIYSMTNLNDHIKQQQEVNRGKLTQLEDSKKPTPGIEETASKLTREILLENNIVVEDMLTKALTQAHQAGIDEAYQNVLKNIISDDVEELTAEGLRREIIFRVKYELKALQDKK